MVVAATVLQVIGLHDLHVGEIGDKGGKEQREDGDEPGKALAQGRAAQNARLARRLDRGSARHLGLQTGSLIASAEQQADDDEAREQRRATLAHEGKRQARKRNKARDATDDDEGLQADGRGEADSREGRHVGFGACCGEKSAHGKEHEQEDDARCAEQAHLLGNGRENEVALHLGDESGHAPADAATEQATIGKRVQRLHELIARAAWIGKGVEPDCDARLHVRKERVEAHAADGDEHDADEHVGEPAGADIDHHEEDAEEQQGASQVALEDDDEHGDDPHRKQRYERAEVRILEAGAATTHDAQQLAIVGEIGGEKQDDENLGNLARLERKPENRQPDARAVVFRSDKRNDRQQQQYEAEEQAGVLVTPQSLDAGYENDGRDHERDAGKEPDDLTSGAIGRETQHEAYAYAAQQKRDGQDCRVCVGRKSAQRQMRDEETHDQRDGHGKGVERQRRVRVDEQHEE